MHEKYDWKSAYIRSPHRRSESGKSAQWGVCTRAPLVVLYDIEGRDVHDPLRALESNFLSGMGLMRYPLYTYQPSTPNEWNNQKQRVISQTHEAVSGCIDCHHLTRECVFTCIQWTGSIPWTKHLHVQRKQSIRIE
jgi:hypothetical protein